jgi:hypothetical protein
LVQQLLQVVAQVVALITVLGFQVDQVAEERRLTEEQTVLSRQLLDLQFT